jgi:hypothetical protein
LVSIWKPGTGARDRLELSLDLLPQLDGLGRQRVREAHVELRAVRADEVYAVRLAQQHRKIRQRSARDHRDMRARQLRQRTQRNDRLAVRHSLGGVVHDRRERAVVVGCNQQRRCRGQTLKTVRKIHHDDRASRNESAQVNTEFFRTA